MEFSMEYRYNTVVSAKQIANLRQSVGWNRMENFYMNPLMTSYFHIACYDEDILIGYFEEKLLPFYKRFGFERMLCGQMQTYQE